MRPSRPVPAVGMPVRIRHFASSEPGVIEAVLEQGRVIVVGGRRFRLHPSTAKFVAEGEPYYGTRVQLEPGKPGDSAIRRD
jgi:predicted thioesterase